MCVFGGRSGNAVGMREPLRAEIVYCNKSLSAVFVPNTNFFRNCMREYVDADSERMAAIVCFHDRGATMVPR